MARKDENLSPDAPEMQLKQLKESQKALKQEQKNQRKEAKKRAKELEDQERELDEQIDGTNAPVVVVTIFIIAIWLGILCLLVKMDVGGFGSNVLTPILKDVPVINKILPSETTTETTKEKSYGGYSSIKEAVEQITELEKQLDQAQNTNTTYSEQIEALKAEVQRLQTFEKNQVEFQRIKEQFYEEDHVELAKMVMRLHEMGCSVVLTNSNHPLVHELYSPFKIDVIQTKRHISCNGKSRKRMMAKIVDDPDKEVCIFHTEQSTKQASQSHQKHRFSHSGLYWCSANNKTHDIDKQSCGKQINDQFFTAEDKEKPAE